MSNLDKEVVLKSSQRAAHKMRADQDICDSCALITLLS